MSKSSHHCDLLIKDELIYSLLSNDDQESLRDINANITDNVTQLVCPTTDLKLTSLNDTIQTNDVKNDNKVTQSNDAHNLILSKYSKLNIKVSKNSRICLVPLKYATKDTNNLVPTNVNLYGTIICSQLLNLNLLGLTNEQIRTLDHKYKVTWPWSVQFDSDRLGNNKRVQQFPLLIVYPKTVAEIQFWISLARKYSLIPSIRSGGHSYEGFSAGGQLILDLSYLSLPNKRKQICIDKKLETVEVVPGVRLGPLYAKVSKKNLQLVGGICPSVAIGGYIAGSGVGYFIRKHGYGCDSLVEVDVILADGSVVTANKCQNHDIFQAVCGAAWAGLGVVSRYKLKVYPLVKVVYFSYSFDISDAALVIHHLQSLTSAPSSISGIVVNLVAGLAILIINGIYFPSTPCPENELRALLQKLIFDPILPIEPLTSSVEYKSWLDIDTELGFETPTIPNYKNRSSYVFEPLSISAWNDIVQYLSIAVTGPGEFLTAFQMLILGGNLNKISTKNSVNTGRNAIAWIQLGMYWSDSNAIFQSYNYVNELYDLLIRLGSSIYADGNVPDLLLSTNYLKSYWGNNVEFLKKVKRQVDPTNLFNGPQTIPLI